MARWSKKIYVMVAEEIRPEMYLACIVGNEGRTEAIRRIATGFASTFARDSAAFDREYFLALCGASENPRVPS